MSTAEILFEDALRSLQRRVAGATELSPSDRAFLAWILQSDSFDRLEDLATGALAHFGEARSYHDLATLGYAISAGVLDDTQVASLRAGLTWLLGRPPEVAGDPAPFVTDAIALFGIALGAAALGANETATTLTWMAEFLPTTAHLPGVEPWQRCLFSAALYMLGSSRLPLSEDPAVADVRVALAARGAYPTSEAASAEADEQRTLELIKEQLAGIPTVRAGMRIAALAWIRRSAPTLTPGRITVDQVVRLLERVPAGLRRWAWEERPRTRSGAPTKWQVDNEYHVQDMLYFLLAPVFPDITDEEYFPSLGQKQPRTDLCIPSLKLIVEVKFLRQGAKVTTIIDEVASDASLYLKEASQYEGLVAFVWDDSRRTEEHPLLRQGLTQIRGVLAAVVVPRPGRMS